MNRRRVLPARRDPRPPASACARAGSQPLRRRARSAWSPTWPRGGVCAAVLGPHRDDEFATGAAAAVPRRRCTGWCSRGGRRRWRPTTRRPAERPGPSLVDDFLADRGRHRGRDRGPAGRHACRPTRWGGRRRWPPGTPRWPGGRGLPLRVLEIGASGGLNLRWDRFWYDTGDVDARRPGQPRALRGGVAGRRAPGLPDLGVRWTWSSGRGATATRIDVGHRRGAHSRCGRTCGPTRSSGAARLEAALRRGRRGPGPGRAGRPGGVGRGAAGRARRRGWRPWWSTRSCGSTCRAASRDRLRAALRRGGRAGDARRAARLAADGARRARSPTCG